MSAIIIEALRVIIEGKVALEPLSFSIEEGSRVVIIGPNGAGKSTLIKALLGLIPCEATTQQFLGKEIASLSRKALAQLVSYIPQTQEIDPFLTVFDWCEMARFPYKQWGFTLTEREFILINEALVMTGIEHLRDRPMVKLSGGERQRAYIAGSLCQETPFIFLDEPNNFLDPRFAKEITRLIYEISRCKGKTILCVTHDINQLQGYFTHVLALKNGRMAFYGAIDEVLNKHLLSDLFDYDFKVVRHEGEEFFF